MNNIYSYQRHKQQEIYSCFSSFDEEIKVFSRFLKSIDFAFFCTSYQLLKIPFQNKRTTNNNSIRDNLRPVLSFLGLIRQA